MVSNKRTEWRKAMKKSQRKLRRQKLAKERVRLEAECHLNKLNDAKYCEWLKAQEELEQNEEIRRKETNEKAWLESEKWQQHLCDLINKRQEAEELALKEMRSQQENEKLIQEKEKFRLHVEEKQQLDETLNLFNKTMEGMHNFLEKSNSSALPAELSKCVYSRPNVKLCPIFERTNCCRFGVECIFNHRRPLLSRTVIIRQFFRHPLLAAADVNTNDYRRECDLYTEYELFFDDVICELERHGKIVNFATTRNVQKHLCGHVFVQYEEERDALKAFISLQGRYYDGNQLDVEFSNLQHWWRSICGI